MVENQVEGASEKALMADDVVGAIAEILLSSVNAPEQEIYRVARQIAALTTSTPVEPVHDDAVEALVRAIEDAGRGYSIRLTKLVDDEATYTMTYRNEVTEHGSYEEAWDHLRDLATAEKREAARSAIAAIARTKSLTSTEEG